jgi:hypothetical protein
MVTRPTSRQTTDDAMVAVALEDWKGAFMVIECPALSRGCQEWSDVITVHLERRDVWGRMTAIGEHQGPG